MSSSMSIKLYICMYLVLQIPVEESSGFYGPSEPQYLWNNLHTSNAIHYQGSQFYQTLGGGGSLGGEGGGVGGLGFRVLVMPDML